MASEKELRDIAVMLSDHERRITALEEGDDGDTDGLPDRPVDPDDGDEERPDRPQWPPETDIDGDVKYEWNHTPGRVSDFNLILEPQGARGECGEVQSMGDYIRATAYAQQGDTTPKACGEKKMGYQPKIGETIVVDLDLVIHDARSYGELFLIDCETTTSSSSGTRMKLTEDGHWRIDGGKLGFDSQNDEEERDGPEHAVPVDERFVATFEIVLAESDTGSVRVLHNGEEVFVVSDIPTMKGTPSKFQCLITAYGDNASDKIVVDTYGVRYRVLG